MLLAPLLGMAQQAHIDSLKERLKIANTDSARFTILIDLGFSYSEINRNLSLYFQEQAFLLAKKVNRPLDEASALNGKGYILAQQKKFPESLLCLQQALALGGEQADNTGAWFNFGNHFGPNATRLSVLASTHLQLGHLMGQTNDTARQIAEYKTCIQLATVIKDKHRLTLGNLNLGRVYARLNRLDSALVLQQRAYRLMEQTGEKKYLGGVYLTLGEIYLKKGNDSIALKYFQKSIRVAIEQKNLSEMNYAYGDLTKYYLSKRQKDSSLYYAKKTIEILKAIGSGVLDEAYENLYKSYQLARRTDSAYKYQGLALITKDSIFKATSKSLANFQKLSFQSQVRSQQLEKEKAAIQNKIRTYVLLASIAILILLAGIFYRNNRQKQKANNILSAQKEEIEQQKEEIVTQRDNLGQALEELRNTQTQLVQREKMASLGELTAGIAHEIQNPLNFVNNFSDVNQEMLEELKAESAKPKAERDDQLETELINDLIENEKKINHHGKRADAIVKGMLQHSRTSSGQKEPTDINALAGEYLRLSYHGLRAKDKGFDALLTEKLDSTIPKAEIIGQDMGRALLNMFNNAFYAVYDKQKKSGPDFKPEVTLTTSASNGNVLIKVRDNGNGIPANIRDKIMQPFFTTKPTGEGTGLGLSLSYDIIVKVHGGNIDLNTAEGEYTEFTITLPLKDENISSRRRG